MITPLNPNPTVNMFDMNTTHVSMSVPLRQCLVMSVLYGNSHQLPAALFASNLVCQVVVGVTGEYPEKILYSPAVDILLVVLRLISTGLKFNWNAKPAGWVSPFISTV